MLVRLRAVAPVLVVLLALIVLTVRLSGVHAHRDLGAAQNPVAHEHAHHQHGHHHDSHVEGGLHAHAEGQVDIELDGLNNQADRLGKCSPLLVGLLLAVSLLLVANRRIVPRPPGPPAQGPPTRSHWRPLLRGPPVVSIA